MTDHRRRVSFVCRQDWGNVSTAMAAAINACSSRLEARTICCEPHPFGYQTPHDFDVETHPGCRREAKRFFDASDYVIYAHERGRNYEVADRLRRLAGIDIFRKSQRYIFHAGTLYRTHHAEFNRRDRVFRKQLVAPDLLRLAAPDAIPLLGRPERVDPQIDRQIDQRLERDELIVTHTPSRPPVKGTADIVRIAHSLEAEFPHVRFVMLGNGDGPAVGNRAVLELKRWSHVHVDQFNDLGGIGISGIEALTAGNIVLGSRHRIIDAVWRMWQAKPPPIIDVGTSSEKLHVELRRIAQKPRDGVRAQSRRSVAWVRKHLSYERYTRFLEETVFGMEPA